MIPPPEYWNGAPIQIVYTDRNGDSHDLNPWWKKNTLRVLDSINSEENECSFTLFNPPSEFDFSWGETIHVYQGGVALFGGKMVKDPTVEYDNRLPLFHFECPGFSRLLKRKFVRNLTQGGYKIYSSTNDVAVMQDLITNYAPGFTQTKVKTGSTVNIEYLALFCSLPEAFDRVREHSGKYWKVDANRDIEYYSKAQQALVAANVFPCGDAMPHYIDLQHSKGDIRQLKNRVILHGDRQSTVTRQEFFYMFRSGATLRDKQIQLGYRPIQGTVAINSPAPLPNKIFSVGYDPMPAIPTSELYVNCDFGKIKEGSATFDQGKAATVWIKVAYKYRQPIEMVREDLTSQAVISAIEGDDGIYDSVEFHREMISQQGAADLCDNILANWATPDENGMVTVWYPGVRAGWLMDLAVAHRGIDNQYVVQQIETTSMGDGIPGRLEHRITYGLRYHLPSFYNLWSDMNRKIDTIARAKENIWNLTA